ncbi:SdpI family protein [Falsarthrobacter nasiphocae]|uniref:Membrane protein n=1 Tax=Falsarthrobacter nasiphocae TaxID=189863 RepID=A0AAE3YHD0_9MICC|nr:SdpI family protein [Falsarthrobacter nasiphocae]MDR6892031.1 putative membrane protein [Falsarthrobacter nasiphocae]
MDIGGVAVNVVGLVLVSAVFLSVAGAAKAGTLPPNGAVGIRTRATKANDAAWYAGHIAGAPVLKLGGAGGLVLAVVAAAVLIIARASTPALVISLAGYAAILAAAIISAVKANAAARPLAGGGPGGRPSSSSS